MFLSFRGSVILMLKDEETKVFLASGLEHDGYCAEPPQTKYPDFPQKLEGRVGLYVDGLGLLVCGGTDRRDYDSKICWSFSEQTGWKWKQYDHPLTMGRIRSFIVQIGRKVIIKGGESSEFGCEYSYEELDLDNLESGWKLKFIDFEDEVIEDLCYGSNAITFNMPCKS